MTDAPSESAPAAAPKKRGCGFWLMCAVGVLIALIVLVSVFGPSKEELAVIEAERLAGETKAAEAEAVPVTAMELWHAYDANEAAAQQAYGGTPLLVTGTIEGIQLGMGDEPFATLETGNQFQSVQVDLSSEDPAKVAALAKGQQLTALCLKVSEVVGTPMLDDCSLR